MTSRPSIAVAAIGLAACAAASPRDGLAIYKVDAFAAERFAGNPAAVVFLDDKPHDDRTLRAVAEELNISETAFVRPLDAAAPDRARRFALRWFSPTTEVPLCGHATLATAKVVFDELHSPFTELAFETESGTLIARKVSRGIELDFPMNEPVPTTPPPELLVALAIDHVEDAAYSATTQKLVLHLADERAVRAVRPDFAALLAIRVQPAVRGIIVTARGTGDYDIVSRYFAPWVGVNEDPVTGSAHTVLAPYWAKRLGKDELVAYQASARGGVLRVRVDRAKRRVHLTGTAVVVAQGALRL